LGAACSSHELMARAPGGLRGRPCLVERGRTPSEGKYVGAAVTLLATLAATCALRHAVRLQCSVELGPGLAWARARLPAALAAAERWR
jgi:hypothetical protein